MAIRPRYPIPNSRWAAFPPPVLVPAAEERAAGRPLEAARALGAPCEEPEEAVEETGTGVDGDEVRVKARSGPNSRLALLANVSAGVDVAGLANAAPSVRPTPGTAPVSR